MLKIRVPAQTEGFVPRPSSLFLRGRSCGPVPLSLRSF